MGSLKKVATPASGTSDTHNYADCADYLCFLMNWLTVSDHRDCLRRPREVTCTFNRAPRNSPHQTEGLLELPACRGKKAQVVNLCAASNEWQNNCQSFAQDSPIHVSERLSDKRIKQSRGGAFLLMPVALFFWCKPNLCKARCARRNCHNH